MSEFVFIGTPSGVRDNPEQVQGFEGDDPYRPKLWTFEVDEVLKGGFVDTIEIGSGLGGGDCGVGFDAIDGPIGIVTHGPLEQLAVGICGGVWDPAQLIEVRDNPITPWGEGPIEAIAAGRMGEARVVGLNEAGEPVIYGMGAGMTQHLALCPGGNRFLELVAWPTPTLVVRETATFDILREVGLWESDPDHWFDLKAFTCLTESGGSWAGAFTTWEFDRREDGRLFIVRGDERTDIPIGAARSVAVSPVWQRALVLTGDEGTRLDVLDITTGDLMASLEIAIEAAWSVAVSPSGNGIAILATTVEPPNWWGGRIDTVLTGGLIGGLVFDDWEESEIGPFEYGERFGWLDDQHVGFLGDTPLGSAFAVVIGGTAVHVSVDWGPVGRVGDSLVALGGPEIRTWGPWGRFDELALVPESMFRASAIVPVAFGPTPAVRDEMSSVTTIGVTPSSVETPTATSTTTMAANLPTTTIVAGRVTDETIGADPAPVLGWVALAVSVTLGLLIAVGRTRTADRPHKREAR